MVRHNQGHTQWLGFSATCCVVGPDEAAVVDVRPQGENRKEVETVFDGSEAKQKQAGRRLLLRHLKPLVPVFSASGCSTWGERERETSTGDS